MLKFTTAGESHGQALVAVLEGMPAGMSLRASHIDDDLGRRMTGHGRGARMTIEADQVEFLGGVRAGETLGSPIAMLIRNRDWDHWIDVMSPAPDTGDAPRRRQVKRPRPGHADLGGLLKYDRDDARDVLERASARETAARVACGAVARQFLSEFGVEIGSHVLSIGAARAKVPDPLPRPLNAAADGSPTRCLDPQASTEMVALIDQAKREGNTLGGVVEVVARGVVVGLGSHVSWDRKLDGRIGSAMLSIPAAKGVEIGLGFGCADLPGSEVHDEIEWGDDRLAGGFRRRSNRAGGLEGGITTGEPIVIRIAKKPIATLMRPLATVNLTTGQPDAAQSERSDVTAVPAMGVIAEAMLALVLADAFLEKFGGDSLGETRRAYDGYLARLDERRKAWRRDH